jgi:hypothetical protein
VPRRPASRSARLRASARALDARVLADAKQVVARLDLPTRAGRFTREVSLTLTVVLLVGMGAATAETDTAPASSATAAPATAPAPTRTPATEALSAADLAARAADLSRPSTPPAPAPKPVAKAAPAAAPAKVERWLPTGTGMWLHEWRRSESGHASQVMARTKASGLTHLYVQTGSSKKGWIGEEVLSQLMPATKGTDVKVIAWDFPKLIDPEADARRMARAAWWNRPGAPMVSAVAPDIETAAEGTRLSTDRVVRYYRELRKALPARTAILATVPWPSEQRTGMYPYAATAPFADAFVPMAYWYNRSPSVVTKTSMQWLKRFGKPVMPVGQGYDGRLDAPYLKPDPHPDKSVAAFVYVAREQGAQSLSLWSWQTTGSLQWGVLAKAAGTVGPKPAPVAVAAPPAPAAPAQTTPLTTPAREKAKDVAPGRQHKRDRDQARDDKDKGNGEKGNGAR